jgi:hypothetical protein
MVEELLGLQAGSLPLALLQKTISTGTPLLPYP